MFDAALLRNLRNLRILPAFTFTLLVEPDRAQVEPV